MKKYELTDNTKQINDCTLTQIKAAYDFGGVKKGDLGGWIESEESIGDDVWIGGSACVYREATITGGTILGGEIIAGIITGGNISGGTIVGGRIISGIIKGGVISSGWIEGGKIKGGWIDGGTIRGGTVRGGIITEHNHIGFNNVGRDNDYLLAYVDNNQIMMSRGCFHGTLDEFYKAVDKTHGDNEHGCLYRALRPAIETKLRPFLEIGETS